MNQQYHSEEIFADILQKLTVFHSQDELAKWIDSLNLPLMKRNPSEVEVRLKNYLQIEYTTRTEKILNEYNTCMNPQNISSSNLTEETESETTFGIALGSIGVGSMALLSAFGFFGIGAAIAWSVVSLASGFFISKLSWANQVAQKAYPKYLELTEQYAQQLTNTIISCHGKVNSHPQKYLNTDDIINTCDSSLTLEQLRVKEFLQRRNIRYLVHFTDKRNIFSIKKFGLLPVSLLMQKQMEFVANDDARYDGHEDGISLSISEENIHVKQAFESRYPDREYQIIRIDASVLYLENTPRIYCQTNAATVSGRKGSAFEDLEAMFAQTVCYTLQNSSEVYSFTRHGQPANQPTVHQAEILWLGEIPLRYLHFD